MGKSDKSDGYYAVYEHYSGLLRTWFVAYGIGAPVLLFTNESLWKTIVCSSDAKLIGFLFLAGVLAQVLITLINKAIMWGSYYGEGHQEFRSTLWYKCCDRLRGKFVIDLLIDIGTLVLFGLATYLVFDAL